MLTKRGGSSAEFIQRSLARHNKVRSIDVIGSAFVKVTRTDATTVVIAATSAPRLDAQLLGEIIHSAPEDLDYVVNIPVESLILGDAIMLARRRGIGVGHFRDLMSALGEPDVAQHRSRGLHYVERGLAQHDKVESAEPIAERHYRITRQGLPAITVVFLHEYDLTVEHVRTAKQRYGSFAAIVVTDPHGGPTGDALALAATMNVRLLTWKEFYGALNKRRI
jgi:hypothetical protein